MVELSHRENSHPIMWFTVVTQKLDLVGQMSREEWDTLKEAYKTWFYNHGQRRANKPLVKYGKSVTTQDVIQVQKDDIQKPGDQEMIAKYQWVVNKVMGGLTQEEIKEAKRLAGEWRKSKPPPKVQAETASQKGGSI
ncbi:hypothetical protein PAXRUDRAFT_15740 [Paxillus rubicundulus Ve08.2h10]|uniref:Uncharacterized protein n=1 Tax=Paxillus rubicundulus Ve08.2h10 TaxID=930991 RepID=A0A0D0DGU0_9AGAM|nr:hypothetical protein PAXRUDRAFT_15740 [Paxillus rubicundulus Ve08.2h10]